MITEYADSLGVDLCFQGFDNELQSLQRMYGSPGGVLLLAWRGQEAIGCVGVRRLTDRNCEMKRLYLRAAARGLGLGRQLVERAIAWAGAAGYDRMCLDTLASMMAARALYAQLGFGEIDPYTDNPLPGTTFMALDLRRA